MQSQFEITKQQFQHRLYSYAYYSLRIAADAEDIVQEAFLKLWENRQDIDPLQVGGWLMRVTQNLIIDHVRKHKTRLLVTDDDADLDLIPQEDGQEQDTHHQRVLKRIVEHSIARLHDPYRTILIMREIQELNYQEIADILCVSVDHVRTDLFRGKHKLRELVRQHPLYHHDLLTG
jgi:RNA polymerase sigma-70 factor (ECF subfamily)